MKGSILFLVLLILAVVKNGISLNVEYMDTSKSSIDVACLGFGSSSSGILKSHRGISYKTNWDKTLILTTDSKCGIVVAVRQIDLRPNKVDNVTLSEVNILTPIVVFSNPYFYRNWVYDSYEFKSYVAPRGQLSVRFLTGPNFSMGYEGFELVYTAYRKGTYCNRNEFNCLNGRCIASFLTCDGHNHCGDRKDQSNCYYPIPGKRNIAAIVSGVVFLLIAVACIIFIIIRRASNSRTEATTVISHPPPAYPPPGTYYPPPPPVYSQYPQGQTNPVYH